MTRCGPVLFDLRTVKLCFSFHFVQALAHRMVAFIVGQLAFERCTRYAHLDIAFLRFLFSSWLCVSLPFLTGWRGFTGHIDRNLLPAFAAELGQQQSRFIVRLFCTSHRRLCSCV